MTRALLVLVLAGACASDAGTDLDAGTDADAGTDEILVDMGGGPSACALVDNFACEEGCFPILGARTDVGACWTDEPGVYWEDDQILPVACVPSEPAGGAPYELHWRADTETCFWMSEGDATALGWPTCADALPRCEDVAPVTVAAELCGSRAGQPFDLSVSDLELVRECDGCLCASVLGVRCGPDELLPLGGLDEVTPGMDVGGLEPPWPSTVRPAMPFVNLGYVSLPTDGRLRWACYAPSCDVPEACDPAAPEAIDRIQGKLVSAMRGLSGRQRVLRVEAWTPLAE
ncbi:MAG: hypothetical protein AAGH15_18590 [Myxococcota bacterium]